MSFLFYYSIFALTTAVMSLFELLYPVIKKRETDYGKVDNKVATYAAYLSISLLMAPLVFLSCVIPSMGEVYRKSLNKGIFP